MRNFSEPIWVAHPGTGQQIDVAPFIHSLALFDAPHEARINDGALNAIRRTIRTLNLTEHNPALIAPGSLVDLYQDLHRLEDMFAATRQQPVN